VGEKPAAVIPNKIFQAAAMGKAFVTRDSAAIRELFSPDGDGVFLVEAGSARALADAILAARGEGVDRARRYHADFARRAGPGAVAEAFRAIVKDTARQHCLTTLSLGAGEPRPDPS
jgi:glycosyltransferase involved in cell wall biosynthesis